MFVNGIYLALGLAAGAFILWLAVSLFGAAVSGGPVITPKPTVRPKPDLIARVYWAGFAVVVGGAFIYQLCVQNNVQ
jgi:hypothetical protein